ncbi:MAG: CDP-diacylglycerol--glycerol-3-phosphate 3-phosphatidyltransferase [Acetobacterales bacterium]
MLTNLPNLLTLSRIAAIPIISALLFWSGGRDAALVSWTACALFTLAALTDMLDGYLARTRRETSRFGQFLDPVADKLLVAAVLLLLVGIDRIIGVHLVPALVILCREILVSGLREFLAGTRVSMPVTQLAKWKTTIQMVALGFLIVGDTGPHWLPVSGIGLAGLWIAALLTLITGYDYFMRGMRHIVSDQRAGE